MGMHAGILLIPVAGGSSDETVPAPNPEGESITVTRIPPQQPKPDKPAAGQAPIPNRPATTAATPAPPKALSTARGETSAGAATSQPRRQVNGRRSSLVSQRSVGRSAANGRADDNGRSNPNAQGTDSNNQSSPTALNNPNESSGLAPLPESDAPGSTTISVPSTPSGQTAPTLTALRDGAKSRDVPNLLQAFLARLHHSVLSTTEPEVEEAKRRWLADLGQQAGGQGASPETLDQALKLSYPLTTFEENGPRQIRSCLNPLPVKGLVGVVVEANGAIATEPTLLRSSGYGFLNDIALEKIKDYENFPEDSAQKIYLVDVEVDYDKTTCVDLAKLKTN
ncbi:hypothetical protein VB741_06165 [Leptothoe sp. PORK10 BA2]|nr:hypothetical protein [Leptothoe sp. PORK10 BA2]